MRIHQHIYINVQKKICFSLKIFLLLFILIFQSLPLTAESNPNVQIFVAYHKPHYIVQNDILIPIQVGRDVERVPSKDGTLTEEEILFMHNNMISDNTKDNISSKNRYYSELTALYWMWKNVKTDYVGLFHYRAFLNVSNTSEKNTPIEKNHFTDKNITELMKQNDLIVAQWYTGSTIYQQYISSHIKSDFDKTLEIIKKKYPQMYPFALKSANNEDSIYLRNMFICQKELFDEYAAWLFNILFELEKQIQDDVLKRDIHQQRVYGFLAERLSTIYFNYRRDNGDLKITYTNIIDPETIK